MLQAEKTKSPISKPQLAKTGNNPQDPAKGSPSDKNLSDGDGNVTTKNEISKTIPIDGTVTTGNDGNENSEHIEANVQIADIIDIPTSWMYHTTHPHLKQIHCLL